MASKQKAAKTPKKAAARTSPKKGSAKAKDTMKDKHEVGKFGGVFSLHQLQAAFEFSSPEPHRYPFNAVCICKDGMVASDGIMLLVQAPMKKDSDSDSDETALAGSHPIVNAPDEVTIGDEGFLLTRSNLEGLMFHMRSRTKAMRFYTSFEDYTVTSSDTNAPKITMKAVVWSRDGEYQLPKKRLEKVFECAEGSYPNWHAIVGLESVHHEVTLACVYLKRLLKSAEFLVPRSKGKLPIHFAFPKDPAYPIGVWLGEGAEAIIMPVEMPGGKPRFKYLKFEGRG